MVFTTKPSHGTIKLSNITQENFWLNSLIEQPTKITNHVVELHSIYHIVQNCGREKLWQISDFTVLMRKTLTNA